MTAGEIVAVYAATASTVTLCWQVFTWRRSRATRVSVRVDSGMTAEPRETLITVTAVNRSEHPVRVVSAGLRGQGGGPNAFASHEPGGTGMIPGLIPAQDSGTAHFHVQQAQAAGLDTTRTAVGFVWLSTGERVESKPTQLMRRS